MSGECKPFRDELTRALEQQDPLAGLVFHGHLALCPHCRKLLEEERALDLLLAEAPRPRMPEEVVARLLRRLAEERAAATLDHLLERVESPTAPSGLSARVLRGIAATRREAALDALLERVPRPIAPEGLTARVLRSLAAERAAPRGIRDAESADDSCSARDAESAGGIAPTSHAAGRVRATEPPLARHRWRTWLPLAAAAALIVSIVVWSVLRARPKAPSAELLAELELLESIELLQGSDLDVLLSDLPEDEIDLLQWTSESASGTQPSTPANGARSNG
jgi:hypothetical protein